MSQTKRTTDQMAADAVHQHLSFLLDDTVFAIEISLVREIIQFAPLTSVPMMPSFVRGVLNLRGAVVPVIDLKARFGRPAAVVGKKTCIVIFHALRDRETIELGLMVDAVSAVIDVADSQVEPPPQFGSAIRRDFIRGMARWGEGFVVILDPGKALDVDEMADLASQTT